MGLILIDHKLLVVLLHLFDESKEVTNALFTLVLDLDRELVTSEVNQMSLAESILKLVDDTSDLLELHNLSEKLLHVDLKTLINLSILSGHHTISRQLMFELGLDKIIVGLVIIVITVKPFGDRLLHCFK